MTDADTEAFTEALQGVAYVCTTRRVPDDLVAAYFRFLRELPIEPLVRALEKFGRTAETGRKFPSPREIRTWVTTGATTAGMTADQETHIRARVTEAMDAWERDGKVGSARTTFELAWQSALVAEGCRGDVRPRLREATWQRWLWHGAATGDAAPQYTDADAETILRETAAKPLTNVHPNLEAARKADGGARLLTGVFGDVLRTIARRRDAAARRPPGQPVETLAQACARGDCQYANATAPKPDWTKTCPGHHGNVQCPRRIAWGAIHERPRARDREPGEDG